MPGEQRKFFGLELESKINVGDILTMIGMFCAVVVISFGVWRDLYDRTNTNDKKILVVENKVKELRREIRQDREDIREDLSEIKVLIRRLEGTQLKGFNNGK